MDTIESGAIADEKNGRRERGSDIEQQGGDGIENHTTGKFHLCIIA